MYTLLRIKCRIVVIIINHTDEPSMAFSECKYDFQVSPSCNQQKRPTVFPTMEKLHFERVTQVIYPHKSFESTYLCTPQSVSLQVLDLGNVRTNDYRTFIEDSALTVYWLSPRNPNPCPCYGKELEPSRPAARMDENGNASDISLQT